MVNQLWNFAQINNNIQSGSTGAIQHMVYLNTRARASSNSKWETNRIGLKCETLSITTSKTVPALPIPGIAAITGEAQTLALDLGMASKTVQLGGIITEQFITKKFEVANETDTSRLEPAYNNPSVFMTAHEVAQLLSSSVDSSAFQATQNLNELIILIPTRVNHEYKYHSGLSERTQTDASQAITEYTSIDNLPLMPFSYKVRSQDNKGSIYAIMPDDAEGNAYSNFPEPIHNNKEVKGMSGFIRSFSCNFEPGSPFVTFSMDFEIAFVVG